MENVKLIRATSDDIEKIRKIGMETMYETFAKSNTDENTDIYLKESFSPEKISEELNNTESE